MSVIKVDLKDFSKALKNYTSSNIEVVKKSVAVGAVKSIPELVKNSPIDTGHYASSWDVLLGNTSVTVGNFAPHAPIIEYGARPFTPPLKPLLAWAKRVLNDPSQPPEYSPEVWKLAIGTRNKIQEVGMKPRHIMTKSIPMIIKNIEEELRKNA